MDKVIDGFQALSKNYMDVDLQELVYRYKYFNEKPDVLGYSVELFDILNLCFDNSMDIKKCSIKSYSDADMKDGYKVTDGCLVILYKNSNNFRCLTVSSFEDLKEPVFETPIRQEVSYDSDIFLYIGKIVISLILFAIVFKVITIVPDLLRSLTTIENVGFNVNYSKIDEIENNTILTGNQVSGLLGISDKITKAVVVLDTNNGTIYDPNKKLFKTELSSASNLVNVKLEGCYYLADTIDEFEQNKEIPKIIGSGKYKVNYIKSNADDSVIGLCVELIK